MKLKNNLIFIKPSKNLLLIFMSNYLTNINLTFLKNIFIIIINLVFTHQVVEMFAHTCSKPPPSTSYFWFGNKRGILHTPPPPTILFLKLRRFLNLIKMKNYFFLFYLKIINERDKKCSDEKGGITIASNIGKF